MRIQVYDFHGVALWTHRFNIDAVVGPETAMVQLTEILHHLHPRNNIEVGGRGVVASCGAPR